MTETETKKKKRKTQQFTLLEEQQEEKQNIVEFTEALGELEKQGKRVDIQVCPKCKSPKIRRAQTTGGDIMSHMGLTQPKYECPECGCQEKLVLKATNKPLTVREVELIAEAREIAEDDSR